MNGETFVSMDNIMGLLPEALAAKVDELMEDIWDGNGYAPSTAVFTTIVHAYQDLGLDTKTNREWMLPDINDLLVDHGRIVVRG